jgi:hypothetical protein
MAPEPTIKTARATGEQEQVIATLVLAFMADPAVRRNLYPDSRQYQTHFAPFAKAFGGRAFALGTADYTDGFAGAALWLPPDVHPDDDALVALLRETVAWSPRIQRTSPSTSGTDSPCSAPSASARRNRCSRCFGAQAAEEPEEPLRNR